MSKVKIMPQNFTGDVRQISVTGQQATFSEQDLPCEFILNTAKPNGGITRYAEVSNQTGTHRLSWGNGLYAEGSFDGLRLTLMETYPNLTLAQKEDGIWLFYYRGEGQLDVSISAIHGAINYYPIEQDNSSVSIMGQDIFFRLGDAHAESDTLSLPTGDYVLTKSVRLTKQTGRHHIHTSNGFDGVGTIAELTRELDYYSIALTEQSDEMVFTNMGSNQDITVEMKAQGRSGKDYVSIEQDNGSVVFRERHVIFKLKAVDVDTVE